MSNKKRLKQITDLFVEGTTVFLGDDEKAHPICVYVCKNNSLEEEVARMDSQAQRTEMLVAMIDPMHPEVQHLAMIMSEWSDEELFEAAANQKYDEDLTNAVNDIEGDKEWTEKLEYIRRQPQILDDAGVAEDDPRRAQIVEANKEYVERIQKLANERNETTLEKIKAQGREVVETEFIKQYKDRLSIDGYVLEGRITRMFYALRECDAKDKGDSRVSGDWDHSVCEHSKRLCDNRQEIRELPDHVVDKVIQAMDELAVGYKNLANFPKPQSSSESSAQPNGVAA